MIRIMYAEFHALPARKKSYRQGQMLFQQGDAVASMFLVASGEARLERLQPSGGIVVLQRAKAGSFLAEASLFATLYHCSAIASTDMSARLISRKVVRLRFENDPAFAVLWAKHLAGEVRSARLHAEILSLRLVSSRIDAWIAQNGEPAGRGALRVMAQDIAASPEAVYREMARRRRKPV